MLHIWYNPDHQKQQAIDFIGRGSKIRTCDPLVPNQVRYQTAPCPDNRFSRQEQTAKGPVLFHIFPHTPKNYACQPAHSLQTMARSTGDNDLQERHQRITSIYKQHKQGKHANKEKRTNKAAPPPCIVHNIHHNGMNRKQNAVKTHLFLLRWRTQQRMNNMVPNPDGQAFCGSGIDFQYCESRFLRGYDLF